MHLGHGFLGEDAVRELGNEILVEAAGLIGLTKGTEEIGLGHYGDRSAVGVGVFCCDFLVSGGGVVVPALGFEGLGVAQIGGMDERVSGVLVHELLKHLKGIIVFAVLTKAGGEEKGGVARGDRAGVFCDDLAQIVLRRSLGEGSAGGGDAGGLVVLVDAEKDCGEEDGPGDEENDLTVLIPESEKIEAGIEYLLLPFVFGGIGVNVVGRVGHIKGIKRNEGGR